MRLRLLQERFDGKIFIITGIRIKLGYELTKHILSRGGIVIGTSRFANLALKRYTSEEKKNLTILQCDFISIQMIQKDD